MIKNDKNVYLYNKPVPTCDRVIFTVLSKSAFMSIHGAVNVDYVSQ